MYDDHEYAAWKEAIVQVLRYGWTRPTIVTPVVVAVEAVFSRPGAKPPSWTLAGKRFRYPWDWTPGRNPYIGTIDLDNLTKAALDGVVQGGVLADDRLVVRDGGSRKVFAAEGEPACVEVRFWPA